MQPPIADHAVIGDCRSAALVARDGTIDWLCWPRFDSPALFASLIDGQIGGRFRVGPAGRATSTRRYLPDTNVLETSFTTDGGHWTLTDFMPVASESFKRTELLPDHELLRIAHCHSGEVEIEVEYDPRPGYGARAPERVTHGGFGSRIRVGPGVLDLATNVEVPLSGKLKRTLRIGETAFFRLSYTIDKPAVAPPLEEGAMGALQRSIAWWRSWCASITYDGPWREDVVRSALTLKLLIYAPSGAVVAAPTTSLPEWVGGPFNWDYRYCWPRDGSLIVRALLGLGFDREAEAFVSWLLHTTRLTRPRIGVLYDVFGRPSGKETFLPMRGYRGSLPVRIGNAAADQLQLDVYGEVVDAASSYLKRHHGCDRDTARMLIGFGRYVCEHWAEPDKGIWEPRGGAVPHTHSRVLCWAALDRLIGLCEIGLLPRAPAAQFCKVRDEIKQEVHRSSWSEEIGAYVSIPGTGEADSSLLLLPWYGFEEASSERMTGTWRLIRSQLEARPGHFYRYRPSPSRPEGTFGICGFWAVDFLAQGGGTLEEAEEMFCAASAGANDLGLFSEEIRPTDGLSLGNFPQGLTHVGLLNAAFAIESRRSAPTVDGELE